MKNEPIQYSSANVRRLDKLIHHLSRLVNHQEMYSTGHTLSDFPLMNAIAKVNAPYDRLWIAWHEFWVKYHEDRMPRLKAIISKAGE